MLDQPLSLIVTDLKQWAFCPRVVYFEYCLRSVRPRTYKMEAGQRAHEDEERRANRRNMSAYDLPSGERRFDQWLYSARLNLVGRLDEVVIAPDGGMFPVDYKLTKTVAPNHRVQVMAYGLLLEERYGISIPHGYVLLIPTRKTVQIPFTSQLRQKTLTMLGEIGTMIHKEEMPPPPTKREICATCEFRRFCNDV